MKEDPCTSLFEMEKNLCTWFAKELDFSKRLNLRVVRAELGANTWSWLIEEAARLGVIYHGEPESGSDMFLGVPIKFDPQLPPNQIKFIREELL